jgi:hypothetical protein
MRVAFAAALAAAGCGSDDSDDNTRSTPVGTAGSGGTASGGTGGANAGGSGGGTTGDAGDACAAGFDGDAPGETRTCASTHAGMCFESDQAACACAACPANDCLIAESYPTQVRCP